MGQSESSFIRVLVDRAESVIARLSGQSALSALFSQLGAPTKCRQATNLENVEDYIKCHFDRANHNHAELTVKLMIICGGMAAILMFIFYAHAMKIFFSIKQTVSNVINVQLQNRRNADGIDASYPSQLIARGMNRRERVVDRSRNRSTTLTRPDQTVINFNEEWD